MAVYKVAQDVEADDKLIGPFSFRQFIYLIIVAISIALAWGLSRLFVGLAIIPLPIIIFFGALALPLRKDQPMEIYLAAIVSFYLKPRRRLWVPDGIESLIEITTPKVIEVQRMKDLSQTEAERRLSYLADIADTGGWAIRHTADPFAGGSALNQDALIEAQSTEDVLDESGGIAHSFETMISQSDERHRQQVMSRLQAAGSAPAAAPAPTPSPYIPPIADPYAQLTPAPSMASTPDPNVTFNPYPTEIHQTVINPLGTNGQLPTAPAPTAQASASNQAAITTSEKDLSPDIINLASNSDLSIETIQREANRIQKKHELEEDGEVFISLR
jgi:hypothetical protein